MPPRKPKIRSPYRGNGTKARVFEKELRSAGVIFAEDVEPSAESLEEVRNAITMDSLPWPTAEKTREFANILKLITTENETATYVSVTSELVPRMKYDPRSTCFGRWNTAWGNASPLAGELTPRPDWYLGCLPDRLTKAQQKALDSISNDVEVGALDGMVIFPCFVAEVKALQPLREAERQSNYDAAVALEAILSLFQRAKRDRDLNDRLMVFSLSHDQDFAKIHGHFIHFDAEDGSVTYHRHRLTTHVLIEGDGFANAQRCCHNLAQYIEKAIYPMILGVVMELGEAAARASTGLELLEGESGEGPDGPQAPPRGGSGRSQSRTSSPPGRRRKRSGGSDIGGARSPPKRARRIPARPFAARRRARWVLLFTVIRISRAARRAPAASAAIGDARYLIPSSPWALTSVFRNLF